MSPGPPSSTLLLRVPQTAPHSWGPAGWNGSASEPPAAWAVPTLRRLLRSPTKRFYSRLRAISVHISPEIYSQANIRDPSGGFKRQVLLLLKAGVIDSPRRPTSLLLGGRAGAARTGLQPGNPSTKSECCARTPRGVCGEWGEPGPGPILQGAWQVGVGAAVVQKRLEVTP